MAVTNNALLIRRELLSRIARLLLKDRLIEEIDRIPVDLRPKKDPSVSRCCVYKDRAMLKFKMMALLGFNTQQEDEEITPLSVYASKALDRTNLSEHPLTVVDEACSACVKANYTVTNMCRGCVARPCIVNCPKDAIRFENGHAEIDPKKCVNCGLCQKNCPYHAIIYIPVPCEESCPVGAITKNDEGIEQIDYSKCIYCGRCIVACPFGAVMEKSHLVEVIKAVKSDKKVIAMVAPAIAGQFKVPLQQILAAIKNIGFDEVIEVAKGADLTTSNEAEEFMEKMEAGQPFMTTSCCPSYTAAVAKHIPELKPFVSHTGTPMYYTAQLTRKIYPDAILVFVGPCLAKRHEAFIDPNTDYMLSFEEMGALFIACNIDVMNIEPIMLDPSIMASSRGYPVSSGVMGAVKEALDGKIEIRPIAIDGLNKANIRELRSYVKSCPGNMVEVMACEGGCVSGCNVIANSRIAARQVKEVVANSRK